MAARQLFGSFRKGEANDAETYVASVLTVLMDYDDEVVREVCHPGRGLPARCDFLPTVKELKDACESEAARRARMAKYAELPRYEQKRLPRPPAGPGAYANVLVLSTDHRYAKLVETDKFGAPRLRRDDVDPRLWKWDDDGRGIWVGLSLLDDRGATGETKRFKQYTEDELRRMYTKPADDPSHVKHDDEVSA